MCITSAHLRVRGQWSLVLTGRADSVGEFRAAADFSVHIWAVTGALNQGMYELALGVSDWFRLARSGPANPLACADDKQ